MAWNLFIDDERSPTDVTWGNEAFYAIYPWTIARTLNEVQNLISYKGYPNFVSFDHDLVDSEPTGKDIANWLVSFDLDNDVMPFTFSYFVHSKNPVGKANIISLLDSYLGSKYQ